MMERRLEEERWVNREDLERKFKINIQKHRTLGTGRFVYIVKSVLDRYFIIYRTKLYVCVCSNANPLHYCVLRVPRKVYRWR